MRIIFVRHGHPDYVHDCLTELGRKHAAAAALRLKDEGIRQIFSSTCGRAYETAGQTASLLGLPIVKCDFMREITWGAADDQPLLADGHPWSIADHMVAQGESLLEPGWKQGEFFARNTLVPCVERIAAATDDWLRQLGYTREGLYYRVTGQTDTTVAAFGHGGASTAILSHLFNLPFPYVTTVMGPDYTGVTVVSLPDALGQLVTPRFELMNDARHIQGLRIENYFGN